MSFNRDKALDRAKTKEQLENRVEPTGRTNWLGHAVGKGTAVLDVMLLDGATMEEMQAQRGAIAEHLTHLQVEHGLPIIQQGKKYVFDRSVL